MRRSRDDAMDSIVTLVIGGALMATGAALFLTFQELVSPAGLLLAILGLPLVVWAANNWRRAARRFAVNRCSSCGYDVTGAAAERCSECGAHRPQHTAAATRTD